MMHRPTMEEIQMYKSRSLPNSRYSKVEIAERIVSEKLRLRPKKGEKKDLESFKQDINIDDHVISLAEISLRYETNLATGLTHAKAAEFLKIYGPNRLPPPKSKSMFLTFLEYMFGGFSIILWLATVLSFTGFTLAYLTDPTDVDMENAYLGVVIFCIILITGLFGFYQEYSNTSIMEGFGKMIPKSATVIRSNETLIISAENIVIGDIVLIEGGDCIPADMRILEASAFKVDNSSITGESDPQTRTSECTDVNPLETANLAFYGTNAVEGSAKGLVIACGEETLIGHIAALTSGLHAEMTPIKRELKSFTTIITIIAIFLGFVFLALALIIGETMFESFATFIAIVVANVPEGLLVTMTACLTLTAKKMVKKNCLCKNLHAVETLGSTTVICSDKTGTLTQNKMTVAHMYYDNVVFDMLNERHSSKSASFQDLCRVGILCSRAEFLQDQESYPISERVVKGDASETAILKCMEYLIGDTKGYRNRFPKVFEIPFNSTNKFQVSVHKQPHDEALLLVMKGAPEKIIERCTTFAKQSEDLNLDEFNATVLNTALLELSHLGERVLAFADLILPPTFDESFNFDSEKINFPLQGLRLLGFMSMIDPPRVGVLEAVETCKDAGIRVIMVTGDHPVTALAIAKMVGIISPTAITSYDIAMTKNISVTKLTAAEVEDCTAAVITGNDLRKMKGDKLDDIVNQYDEIVFARTSPQQKLQIVESFQRNFEVVAVTGDGVNDSPALKKADIGISMGISGSDVSKEAADIILLDDNFASIVFGIEEGRLIFDNLKKSIAYMLTSNVPEMMPIILNVLIGIPMPINIMAILIIDVGTDLWPGISLAYEKPEADIMKRKPRNIHEDKLVTMKLILFTNLNIGVIQTLAGMNCYLYVMAEHGFLPDRLLWIRKEWMSQANDLEDSFGQEWSFYERKQLERRCASAFFLAVVITQVADVIICKTRRLSICDQGMGNHVMNFGIIFEVLLSLLVVYCPYVNDISTLLPVNPNCITPAIPYAILIIIFDETRRYLIRKKPNGWFEKETYF